MDNEHGYRLLTVFVIQLIAMIFVYVLGAYYYKSVVRSTSVAWLSVTRWLIEASCDCLQFWSFFISLYQIPASITKLNNHFAIIIETLMLIETNQFVMMHYAGFHSRSCLNTIRVASLCLFCAQLDDYSMDDIFMTCFLPAIYLSDFDSDFLQSYSQVLNQHVA